MKVSYGIESVLKIREIQVGEVDSIKSLFRTTFTQSAGEEEGRVVGDLASELITRTACEDLFGLVAEEASELAGCILFSRLTFADQRIAYILSPVAVHPDQQRKGIGQRLISAGIDALRKQGGDLVMTYGDPDFYRKLGFQPVSVETIPAPFELTQPEGWLGQPLKESSIQATSFPVGCVSALREPKLW